MKMIPVVMIVMLTAGCSGMGMHSSGSSSGAGSSDSSMDIYRPNFNPGPYDESMDPLFKPYFGG